MNLMSCLTITLIATVGWVLNIIQLIPMLKLSLTGLSVLKIIGIFIAPVGVILGFVGFF